MSQEPKQRDTMAISERETCFYGNSEMWVEEQN